VAQPALTDVRQAIGEALYGLAVLAVRRRPREMSLTSASTLATLHRGGPMRLTELAANEGVTQPSMTTLVTNLERAGLVMRNSDPGDRRVVLVAITEAGREHVRQRRITGATSFSALLDQLSEEDMNALAAVVPVLNRLRELEVRA
jgi:DNA-binding MarR family transcriptional regulator